MYLPAEKVWAKKEPKHELRPSLQGGFTSGRHKIQSYGVRRLIPGIAPGLPEDGRDANVSTDAVFSK